MIVFSLDCTAKFVYLGPSNSILAPPLRLEGGTDTDRALPKIAEAIDATILTSLGDVYVSIAQLREAMLLPSLNA